MNCLPVHLRFATLSIALVLLAPLAVRAQEGAISIREALGVPGGRSERSALYVDPLAYRIATGALAPPAEGAAFDTAATGEVRRWQRVAAGADGYFESDLFRGGYLYATVEVDRPAVMILEASGPGMVWVNDEPRAGDVYDYGWLRHPVALRKGRNAFVFTAGRGRVRARLVPPEAPVALTPVDPTLPDLLQGSAGPQWGAVRVLNATARPVRGLRLRARVAGGAAIETDAPEVGALTSRKVGFRLAAPGVPAGAAALVVELVQGGRVLDADTLEAGIVRPDERQKRTYVSGIDGSVQYFSLVPGRLEPGVQPALFLSLHGASVEATNQARAYQPKDWGHVVAATNRRPYGFDWEDWGRMDALEVLGIATRTLGTDTMRTYLTGHSMGGHGTWHVGATYPDKWAAIAPSCGWYEWWSYGLKRPEAPTRAQEAALRALNPSHTLGMVRNYRNHGVYVLHGQVDETVPVGNSRTMRQQLAAFHTDFAYHEVPGAGHWWGDESVDFPPIFEFFRWHRRKTLAGADTVVFSTGSPGVSATAYWLTLYGQHHPFQFSRAEVVQDTARAAYRGTTENVRVLSLATAHLGRRERVTVLLDGDSLAVAPPADGRVWLERPEGGHWRASAAPDPAQKSPLRYGTFKDGFRERFVLVYGTRGTPAENAWALNKARYDAETFWYRGNGAVDVVADVDFDARAEPDRGVVLYGNAETNAAWRALLPGCPVDVRRDAIRIGSRTLHGGDLAALFVRPRPGSRTASVSVVAGTGVTGMKAAYPNPYFMAGTGYPDVFVYTADMLRSGEAGVRAWGYFGPDWSVERGEFQWF